MGEPATLVIGLGNPGREHARTRHNAGWLALDELVRRGRFAPEVREGPARITTGSVDGVELVLARPRTYMNLSGRAGRHLTERLGIDPGEVVVVHDEIDLPLGRVHIKRGGSAGSRGVTSLADAWRTRDFVRVRIGVSRPPEGVDAVDWVLTEFSPEEREQLGEVLGRTADAVVALVRDGFDAARARYNVRSRARAGDAA